MDGDALYDILIGSPSGGDDGVGAAYLVLGVATPSSLALAVSDAVFTGEASIGDYYAGSSVSGAGDVDGDGYDDAIVGCPYRTGGFGYLFFGSASMTSRSTSAGDAAFQGEADGDQAGLSVAAAGDVNTDGFDDVLIGANSNSGAASHAGSAYVVLGSGAIGSISLSAADAIYSGETDGDYAGGAVAPAGDVDSDGYPDILVGAGSSSAAGAAAGATYLMLGTGL